MRPFQDPARTIALPLAIACVDTGDLLKNGAVLILDNFVEPLPDEVPIHWHRSFSKNFDAHILPQM